MILIDTDVLIQAARNDARAIEWIASVEPPTVPGAVAIEFVIGSRDARELAIARRSLESLTIQWPNPQDHALAYDLVLRYRLSSGLSFADYLIAAQALNSQATLYSFNLRHFGAIQGLDVRAPYIR